MNFKKQNQLRSQDKKNYGVKTFMYWLQLGFGKQSVKVLKLGNMGIKIF